MTTHDKISVIRNVNIRDLFLDARPKQIQGLPLVWANARHDDLSAVDWRTTGAYFLLQSITQAGQTVFDVVTPLGNDSQVSKPALVQSANMIEIHYVFENEPAARFHVVTESQNCSQGLAIIDPMVPPPRPPALRCLTFS